VVQLSYTVFPTDFGWIGLLVSPQGLRGLTLKGSLQEALDELGPEAVGAEEDPDDLEGIRSQIEAYFDGEINALDSLQLDFEDAPPFFKAAWEACRSIPPGETRSYAWLAVAAGRPLAPRAAGQAMAKNRVAIVVPCHRVIGSDGGLHGYGGGLEQKARLLELELKSKP